MFWARSQNYRTAVIAYARDVFRHSPTPIGRRLTIVSWTSKGLPGDTISVEGIRSGGFTDPYLIGVSGVTDAMFALVATFSQVRSDRVTISRVCVWVGVFLCSTAGALAG